MDYRTALRTENTERLERGGLIKEDAQGGFPREPRFCSRSFDSNPNAVLASRSNVRGGHSRAVRLKTMCSNSPEGFRSIPEEWFEVFISGECGNDVIAQPGPGFRPARME